jgi:D-alanyl-D-alanine carboxypeptidase
MTCVVVIEVCERYSINPLTERYKTGPFECFIRGTSAEIEPGEIYSIHELLHGLMLPSGNDASLALARWLGNVLLLNDLESNKRSPTKPDVNLKS